MLPHRNIHPKETGYPEHGSPGDVVLIVRKARTAQSDCHRGLPLGSACRQGRHAEAIDYATRSLALQSKRPLSLSDCVLRILGVANLGLGNYQAAAKNLTEALQSNIYAPASPRMEQVIKKPGRTLPGRTLNTLSSIASLFAAVGYEEYALEILSFVFHDSRSWQWAKDSSAGLYARLKATLSPENVAEAETRGCSHRLEEMAVKLLAELREF